MGEIPQGYSDRLYNEDLAPRTGKGTWKTWDLFAWWMSAWHSLADYTAAVGLLVLGLMGWQLAVALCIGVVIIYFISNLMGVAGQKLGVPFPVFARASFGVYGANIPALLRAVVAVAWYGIQTYLASVVIMILALKIMPASEALTESSFLGLSPLGWICFLTLWTAQLIVLYRGMESVRKLSDFAGPAIWVAMIALAVWTLNRANWTLDWSYHIGSAPLSFGPSIVAMASAVFLIVALLSGPVLNFADFTRLAPNRKTVVNGNRLGLLINGIAFCLVAMVITLASAEVYGKAIDDPIVLIRDIDNITVLLLAIIAIGVSTAGINIILNFVSPAYDFANLAPKYISFKTGGVITAVLSIVILPWNLYSNPVVVNMFLGGIGALMGPLFGIIMADYYLIRKGQVNADSLYKDNPDGKYFYTRGTNLNSVYALTISGIVTLCLALIPVFSAVHAFSWPIGTLLGAIMCLVINRARPNIHSRTADLSQEAAEVPDPV
ncbi:NCS1 family nucleobase:cation symporter-1 [Crystallibacter degradans]|uniref:NCS1 family nucleobase:cation symporter-1 n=1 Tax=Crystallibacter degradans TaxID=2726743 RepID=UPI00147503B5|nr:NCS1 family nucleobase:cation symporter-1 [Arthrobacter sp. SF27]NMR29141.1 NCS1 family nucleobase:cation symporter-1 [Arthrobacter sp. SF27]